MKNTLKINFAFWTIFIIGCASAGKSFKFLNRDSMEIGVTTTSTAKLRIGEPTKMETVKNEYGRFEIYTYTYAFATTYSAVVRVLILEFKNDTLNSRVYNSCFSKDDNTDFNYNANKLVEQGITSKAEVLKILGEPTGKANYPSSLNDFAQMKCLNATTMWSWIYTKKMEHGNVSTMKTKSIILAFDNKDIVCNMQASNEIY